MTEHELRWAILQAAKAGNGPGWAGLLQQWRKRLHGAHTAAQVVRMVGRPNVIEIATDEWRCPGCGTRYNCPACATPLERKGSKNASSETQGKAAGT